MALAVRNTSLSLKKPRRTGATRIESGSFLSDSTELRANILRLIKLGHFVSAAVRITCERARTLLADYAVSRKARYHMKILEAKKLLDLKGLDQFLVLLLPALILNALSPFEHLLTGINVVELVRSPP